VIAPSFADIFYNNCFANGILPLVLPFTDIQRLASLPVPLEVDLPGQTVKGGGLALGFEIDPARKSALLEGMDEIGRSERSLPAIDAYEAARFQEAPWS
jgi:3-isopropylmalate/(R)-2-methylmalate dehydratase small subunit